MTEADAAARAFTVAGNRIAAEAPAPGLHVVATPIGNLADISLRALSVLAGAERILCEDTRVTSRLLQRYGIRTPMRAYHDHNAEKVRPAILADLAAGARLALVSDAGTPLVSDPGYKLVRAALAAGVAVHMVPGPSAPLMALVLSGLPSDRFFFAGFVPAGEAKRASFLQGLAEVPATLLLFETAARLDRTLAAIAALLGARDIAVARELTKLHEEVLRGPVDDVRKALAKRPPLKGEITLVVAPPGEAARAEDAQVDAALAEALRTMPAGRAAAELSRRFGLPRNELYQRAVALRARAGKDPPDAAG